MDNLKQTGYTTYAESNARRQRHRRMWLTIIAVLILLVLIIFAWKRLAAQDTAVSCPAGTTPAGATVEQLMQVDMPAEVPNFTKEYSAMKIAFNPQEHVPNYVCWELTRGEVGGNAPRSKNFYPDNDVPGCATLADYRGSGYQRGHMMPAADAKFDADVMNETFYLTNMCPQVGALNAGAWGSLEEKCRTWATRDSAIIIIAGPVLTDRITDRIGDTGVAVPKRFFKVILAPYANPPRAIGFIMPNAKVPGGMEAAAVSVDDVEQITGFDFFSALPDDVEDRVESECKFQYWSRLK